MNISASNQKLFSFASNLMGSEETLRLATLFVKNQICFNINAFLYFKSPFFVKNTSIVVETNFTLGPM